MGIKLTLEYTGRGGNLDFIKFPLPLFLLILPIGHYQLYHVTDY